MMFVCRCLVSRYMGGQGTGMLSVMIWHVIFTNITECAMNTINKLTNSRIVIYFRAYEIFNILFDKR